MSRLNEGAEPSFGIVSAAIAKTSDARLEGIRTDDPVAANAIQRSRQIQIDWHRRHANRIGLRIAVGSLTGPPLPLVTIRKIARE